VLRESCLPWPYPVVSAAWQRLEHARCSGHQRAVQLLRMSYCSVCSLHFHVCKFARRADRRPRVWWCIVGAVAGDLDTLLDAYDRDRRTLPAPVEPWSWGWTKSAETWNGRIAMVAIIIILLLEATTGQSFLSNVMVLD